MLTRVVVAPGAEENPLVAWLHDTLSRNLRATHPDDVRARGDLSRVRATIGLVARDIRVTATLRIDRGSVVLHDGAVGTPDLTFAANLADLVSLAEHPMSTVGDLPLGPPWRQLAKDVVASRFRIYGLATRPMLVLRVLRLIAAPPSEPNQPRR